jgi:hypothetical protein
MGNAWTSFTHLHPAAITGIVVGSVVFIVGLIILILWLSGVIFKGDDGNVVIPSAVTATVAPEIICPSNGVFTKLSQVNGTEPDFGTPLAITDDGMYFSTNSSASVAVPGSAVIYQRSGDTYTLLDTSTFTLPAMTRIGYALISAKGNHVVSGVTNINFETSQTESYLMTTKSGNTFFNTEQFIDAVADGFPLVARPYFPSPLADDATDNIVYLSFRKATNEGLFKEYRYSGESKTWTLKQMINGPDPAQQNFFGLGLAQHGNVLVVTQLTPSKAQVFTRTDENADWVYQADQSVTPASGSPFWGVDCAMTTDGLILVVSDAFSTVNTIMTVGEVYIYKRGNTDEPFVQTQIIQPQAIYEDQFFGLGTFLFGNTLFLPCNDAQLSSRHNEVYVIDVDTGLATFTQRIDWPYDLTPPDPGVSTAWGSFFHANEELFLLMGTNNATGLNGAVSVFSTACIQ